MRLDINNNGISASVSRDSLTSTICCALYIRYAIFIITLCAALTACDKHSSHYDFELSNIQKQIRFYKHKVQQFPKSKRDHYQLIYFLNQQAGLTGDFSYFAQLEDEITQSLLLFGETRQLLLFSLDFNLKVHRLKKADSIVRKLDFYSDLPILSSFKGDIALQRGNYKMAYQYYMTASQSKQWHTIANLAYYLANTGLPEEADRLYQQAQNKLSVKQLRHFAWLELQRGVVQFNLNNFKNALHHYLSAQQIYSGYWLIEEHIAEAYARLGEIEKAISLYQHIIKNSPHPDLISALARISRSKTSNNGDTYTSMADVAFAKNYSLYPEATYSHLVDHILSQNNHTDYDLDFYASQNYLLRPNTDSLRQLILAKIADHDFTNARSLLSTVLESPWQIPDKQKLVTLLEINSN